MEAEVLVPGPFGNFESVSKKVASDHPSQNQVLAICNLMLASYVIPILLTEPLDVEYHAPHK